MLAWPARRLEVRRQWGGGKKAVGVAAAGVAGNVTGNVAGNVARPRGGVKGESWSAYVSVALDGLQVSNS